MTIFIGVALTRAGSATEDLRQIWLDRYLPLVHKLPGLVRFDWNVAAERFSRETDSTFAAMPVLGFTRFTFADGVTLKDVLASEAGKAMLALEAEHLQEHIVLEVEELTVIDPPARHSPGLMKTMSILRRADGASTEQFLHEWRVVHIPMVKQIRQVIGYRQNRVLNRMRNWTQPIDDVAFPFDGSVELWYPSLEKMQEAAASPEAQVTGAHAYRTSSRIEKFQIHDVREWPL